jgi:carbonyl reductase 1
VQVNNAGVLNDGSTYDDAKLVMDTNYHGVKQVTKALLPYMKASARGSRIVNVSSELGNLEVSQL